ncbi:MAG: aromatic ring-hydroxylating dioxygenase subunit alpha [Actinobacteria bacterium]|nr:aromatic ring-hydroxylating dioxygenase subunit alpha [Actinomycetota bacterium]
MHRLEEERIFARTWQYVGHAGQVSNPGDVFPVRLGRIPGVVVRDLGGELRALVNVCRHRGSLVVDEPGNRRTLQCPYHAWTYELDGRLRSAPRSEREASFDRSRLALVPLALDAWGPFLFVNPDPDAAPLADILGDLPARVASAGVDVDGLSFHHRAEWEVAANWKLLCENFLECYHCSIAHQGFSSLVDVSPDSYRLEASEWFSSQYGPVRSDGTATYDAVGEVERGQFHLLWPNTCINIFPGRPNLSIGPIMPTEPERTSRFLDYFFASGTDESWIRDLLQFDDQVGREDTILVERVQLGVRSGVIPTGRLLEESEHLIAHFQRLVAAALSDMT